MSADTSTDPAWCTDDWPTTRARFDVLLRSRRTRHRPRGLTGSNFVTSELLGFVLDADGEPVELTTGWVPQLGDTPPHRVFGLTWARGDDDTTSARDSLVWDWPAVLALLGVRDAAERHSDGSTCGYYDPSGDGESCPSCGPLVS